MVNSYTLIRINPEKVDQVYEILKNQVEVSELIPVHGEYDLILKLSSDEFEDLDDFIFNKLRTIDGIKSSQTLIESKYFELS